MNKKGFTLVELLGVLVIIALLTVIVATPIIAQINKTSSKLDSATLKILYNSAGTYLDDNINSYPKKNGLVYYISIGQLVDSKTLNSNYLTTYSEDKLSRSDAIKVVVEDGGYQYSYANASEITDINENDNKIASLYDAYIASNADATYDYLGGKYFQGNVNNNYVYYSGLMWRIMGENEDGSIKLVTDEAVTTLNYGATANFDNSYIGEWLNDYFISRLKNIEYLNNQYYCSKAVTSTAGSNVCDDVAEEALLSKKVLLLNSFEFNASMLNSNSYLKGNYAFMTMTNNSSDTTAIFNVLANGTIESSSVKNLSLIRPVISLKSDSTITQGKGTKSNPYILYKGKTITGSTTLTLNDLNLTSGEYVKLNNKTYRVVENDKSEVKLIINNVSTAAMIFDTNSTFNINSNIGFYLNRTLYNSDYKSLLGKVKTTFWYQGLGFNESEYYKSSFLSKSNSIYGVTVGLPKIGEILTAPIYDSSTTSEFWTISKASSSEIYRISLSGGIKTSSRGNYFVREVIIVDASSAITSGYGTSTSPYIMK